ncbi:MAG TPA: hypothetical protein VF057_09790, partial [Thermoanaerobaculia bacterium]
MSRAAAVLVALILAGGSVGAQDLPPTKISGEAFGDYYWVVLHDDSGIEGRNGFWLRRLYLTFDQSLSESLSARLRFEGSQPGDFTSD